MFLRRNGQKLYALPNVKHETLNRHDGVDANQPPDGVRTTYEPNWKEYVGACRVPRTNVPTLRSHFPPKG